MGKISFFAVCLLLVVLAPLSGRAGISEDSLWRRDSSSIVSFFEYQEGVRSEKLWLHTDRSVYRGGDRIWMKGYLVDAVTLRPEVLSRFIYVELTDRRGRTVIRRKFVLGDGGFRGDMSLPIDIEPGNYLLRGYTGWMRNGDSDLLFYKELTVEQAYNLPIDASIRYSRDGTAATLRLYDRKGEPWRRIRLVGTFRDSSGRETGTCTLWTGKDGTASFELPPDKQGGRIDIAVADDAPTYRNTFYFPTSPGTFSVSFFPEGGDLLDGIGQRVAFKAQGDDGYSVAVSGFVFRAPGDTVASLRSEHDGMGQFMLNPSLGDRYYAEVVSAEGDTARFDLPSVKGEGYALSAAVSPDGDVIRFRADRAGAEAGSAPLYLVVHQGGRLRVLRRIPPQGYVGRIATDPFRDGIVHFLLTDASGSPLSERLVFVRHSGREFRWRVEPDKPRYGAREKVRLDISVADSAGRPVVGNFSVSVTDRRTVAGDSLSGDIRTGLLLTSDLKGYVESPGYYFLRDDPQIRRHLDLLMMTHGWRRFRTDRLLEEPQLEFRYYPEQAQTIRGRVKDLLGRPASRAKVSLLGERFGFLAKGVTDDKGYFEITEGVDFQGPAVIQVGALTRRNRPTPYIEMTGQCPSPAERPPYPPGMRSVYESGDTSGVPSDSFSMKRKAPGLIEIDGTYVWGTRKTSPFSPVGGESFDSVQMAPYGNMTLDIYSLWRLTGKERAYLSEFAPEKKLDLAVVLGRPEIPKGEWGLIHIRDVETVYRPYTGLHTFFTLKPNYVHPFSGAVFHVLGYSRTVEFYSPVYDTPEKAASTTPDLRRTLHWQPVLRTDAQGRGAVEFYSADDEQPEYDIAVEGITDDGRIGSLRCTLPSSPAPE